MFFSLTWEVLTGMKTNSNHSKLLNWATPYIPQKEKIFFLFNSFSVSDFSFWWNFEAAVMFFSLTWKVHTNMETNWNHSKLSNWAPHLLLLLEKEIFFVLFLFCFWFKKQKRNRSASTTLYWVLLYWVLPLHYSCLGKILLFLSCFSMILFSYEMWRLPWCFSRWPW
jgi:hypothetical protein